MVQDDGDDRDRAQPIDVSSMFLHPLSWAEARHEERPSAHPPAIDKAPLASRSIGAAAYGPQADFHLASTGHHISWRTQKEALNYRFADFAIPLARSSRPRKGHFPSDGSLPKG